MAGPLDYQDMFNDDEIMQMWQAAGGQGQPGPEFVNALRGAGARQKYAQQYTNSQDRAWQASRQNQMTNDRMPQPNRANWNNWSTPTQGLSSDGKSFGGVDFQTGRALGPTNNMTGNLQNAAGNNISSLAPVEARMWAASYEANRNKAMMPGYADTAWGKRAMSDTYSDGTSKAVPLWQKQGLKLGGTPYTPPTGGNSFMTIGNGKPAFAPPPPGGVAPPGTGLSNTTGHMTTYTRPLGG